MRVEINASTRAVEAESSWSATAARARGGSWPRAALERPEGKVLLDV